MSDKLIGITTSPIYFQRNIGSRIESEMYPVSTLVEIDAYEMESNPNFFHAAIAGSGGRIHAYINRDQVAPA